MDITRIRNEIVSGLYNYIEVPVVHTPTTSKAPPYPYVGYSYIVTQMDDGSGHKELVDDSEGYVTERFSRQVRLSLSVSVYGLDAFEVKDISSKCYDYFKFISYHQLKSKQIVVVDVTAIENRDMIDVDEYERREGFDVRIRASETIDRRVESMDNYSINENKNEEVIK